MLIIWFKIRLLKNYLLLTFVFIIRDVWIIIRVTVTRHKEKLR